MKKDKIKLNLAKICLKPLTFWLRYAKMISEVYWYSGIVVCPPTKPLIIEIKRKKRTSGYYTAVNHQTNNQFGGRVCFGSQKSQPKYGILGYPDKKQKQKNWLNLANLSPNRAGLPNLSQKNQLLSGSFGPAHFSATLEVTLSLPKGHDRSDQSAVVVSATSEAEKSNILLYFVLTFCFFVETFFCCLFVWKNKVENHNYKQKQKLGPKTVRARKQNYDRWPLSARGHFARNRSQQNHADSLGRRGINSQSPSRQSGLALLYTATSGRNHSLSQANRLLPQGQRCRKIAELKRDCWEFNYFNPAGVSLLSFLISQKYVLAETKNQFLYPLGKILTNFLIFCQGITQCPVLLKILLTYLSRAKSRDILTNLLTYYDRWLLPLTRHFAANRSQQNHADSLGRRGINSQSPSRQSGLALLYQRSSRRNYSFGERNELLSESRFGTVKSKQNCSQSVFPRTNQIISHLRFALTPTAQRPVTLELT